MEKTRIDLTYLETFSGGDKAFISEMMERFLIDAKTDQLILKVNDDEIEKRRVAWKSPITRPEKGVLSKYAKSVKSASLGAITD